jgi:hypothetical protein
MRMEGRRRPTGEGISEAKAVKASDAVQLA